MSIGQGLALTQQEKRRRGNGIYKCELPQDLMIEILTRLPTKSMMRSKCVSKQWLSLIFCRYFCNSLFTATRQQPRVYMFLLNIENRKRVLLSASLTSPNNTCLLVDQDLSISGMGSFFLNGVRGFMCFSVREKACIYNPSTKQLLTLPEIKPDIIASQSQNKYFRWYYIGHDPVSDQYKLLCTIVIASTDLAHKKSEHWVFVLEAGGSWKKVVPSKYYHHYSPVSQRWSTSGSVVHYMARLNMSRYVVVSFDVRSEELTIINHVFEKGDLIDTGGKRAIFDHKYLFGEDCMDLWVLEDGGKKEWSKQTLVLQPCLRHLVGDTKLVVKGTTQEGKVILAARKIRYPFLVLCYDIHSNDLRKVEIKGIPQLWVDKECHFDLKFMDESESFVFLET